MPQVIIFTVADWLLTTGISWTAAEIIATVLVTSVIAAASYGLGSLLAPSAPKASDGQLNLQQPLPFRRRVYGRAKLGGYFAFYDSTDGDLYSILTIATHEIDGIEEYWVADRQVQLDGDGWVINVIAPSGATANQFNPHGSDDLIVRVLPRLGNDDQAPFEQMIVAFPTLWTSQHIGLNITDCLMIQRGVTQSDFPNVYPGGAQTYRQVLRGAKIRDMRTSGAEAWNDNAVWVLRDYLTSQDGWRIDQSFFDTGLGRPITLDQADIADELVPLKDGGTEARYRIWGFYDFNDLPRNILVRMLAACGGWLQPQRDGTIAIKVGAWEEPDVTISDAHILSYKVQHWTGEFDAINQIMATFTYPLNDWQDTDSNPWEDTADIARRGYTKSTTIDARYVASYQQCRRIQKIGYFEAAPEWSVTLTTDAYGLLARNRRFVRLTINELGLDITCRVTSFVGNLQTGICNFTLASFPSDAYDWDPATEEGDPPVFPAAGVSVGFVPTPLTMDVVVQSSSAGAYMVMTLPPWDTRGDLFAHFEYQVDGQTTWTQVPAGIQSLTAQTGFIADGTYNARGAYVAGNGSIGGFFEVDGVIVEASSAAPDPPTNLNASTPSPATTVALSAKAPNSSNMHALRFWRNSVNNFTTATDVSGAVYGSPNQTLSYTDTPSAGHWYYWATAEDNSTPPKQSSADGPATATI